MQLSLNLTSESWVKINKFDTVKVQIGKRKTEITGVVTHLSDEHLSIARADSLGTATFIFKTDIFIENLTCSFNEEFIYGCFLNGKRIK